MSSDLCVWLVQQFRLECEQQGKRADGIPLLDRVRELDEVSTQARIQFAESFVVKHLAEPHEFVTYLTFFSLCLLTCLAPSASES